MIIMKNQQKIGKHTQKSSWVLVKGKLGLKNVFKLHSVCDISNIRLVQK